MVISVSLYEIVLVCRFVAFPHYFERFYVIPVRACILERYRYYDELGPQRERIMDRNMDLPNSKKR